MEGRWTKEEVANVVCQEDDEGTTILSLLDFETQKELAFWKTEKTNEVAHLLSADFQHWLIQQALEGRWSKEDVGSIVCRKNQNNQLILATLDEETKKQASMFNKEKTISAAPYMDADFLQWLYQEAADGRWEKSMVFEAVIKEELNGKALFLPRIKPGRSIENLLWPMITEYS